MRARQATASSGRRRLWPSPPQSRPRGVALGRGWRASRKNSPNSGPDPPRPTAGDSRAKWDKRCGGREGRGTRTMSPRTTRGAVRPLEETDSHRGPTLKLLLETWDGEGRPPRPSGYSCPPMRTAEMATPSCPRGGAASRGGPPPDILQALPGPTGRLDLSPTTPRSLLSSAWRTSRATRMGSSLCHLVSQWTLVAWTSRSPGEIPKLDSTQGSASSYPKWKEALGAGMFLSHFHPACLR